jgi:thioredoxin 1
MSIGQIDSTEHFRDIVARSNLTVVMFSAVWCQPCAKMLPEVERLSYRYPKVTFVKCDVDQHREVSEKCYVRALPTFMYCRAGKQLGFTVGADMRDVRAQVMRFVNDDEKV